MTSDFPSNPASGPWTPPELEGLQARLPQYRFLALIGRGGMGAVFKALHVSLDRLVAIKVLPGDLLRRTDINFAQRFQNEARTMAKLSHPAIVSVFDFGETTDGLLYFVMEFVPGTDVAQMIVSKCRLEPSLVIAITAQVCDALTYAHGHGVIHRDIKPANVLITEDGQVKVADFGLARIHDPNSAVLTRTDVAMGTPDFLAPEALLDSRAVDGRSDLYAVGVMLYQMLVGEVPRGLFQMPGQMTGGEIDPRFDAIITKAMQSNRNARYQTAADLRQGLELIRSKPRSTTGTAPRPKHKAGLARILGILIVLAIAAISALNKGARHADAAQKGAVSAIKSESASPWTDGLAEWLAAPGHEERGLLTPESGGLRMAASGCTLMLGSSLPARSLGDVAVRVKFRHAGANTLDIHLREQAQPGNFYAATFSESGTTSLIRRMNASSTELASFEPPNGFDPTMPHALEFRSEGQQLSCLVDEKLLGTITDSTFSSGQFSVVSKGALIEKVEYRALGKAAASSIPTDTGKPR